MHAMVAAWLLLTPVAAVNAQTTGPAKAEAPKKICKPDPEDTESRIRRRICKTEAEWNGESGKQAGKDQAPKQGG